MTSPGRSDGPPAVSVMLLGATLDELYARIPSINCRGLCHDQCSIIPAAAGERTRMADAGHPLPSWQEGVLASMKAGKTLPCPALSAFGRCRAYDSRPAICRLYGVTQGLPCEYGCTPERVMSDAEAREVLAAVETARS